MAPGRRPLDARQLWWWLGAGAALLGLVALLALGSGAGPPGFGESIAVLFGTDDVASTLVLEVRALRVMLGVLAGMALAGVGVVLQQLLRNPLADPYIVGVSGGAALAGTLAILVLGQGPWVPPIAFGGAAGALFFTLAAVRVGNRPPDVSILLVGVVINAFAAAVITFLKTLVSAEKAQEVLFWLVGFVGYPRGTGVAVVAVGVLASLAVLIWYAPELHLLGLGDDEARRLGVDVERARTVILLAASLATGVVVAETGLIGFVGLIVPHALRLIVGPDPRLLLPLSALCGGAVLCGADAVTRLLFHLFASEPPVGALLAVVGAPLFLLLLRRYLRGSQG